MKSFILCAVVAAATALHIDIDIDPFTGSIRNQQAIGDEKKKTQLPPIRLACPFDSYTVTGDSYAAGIGSAKEMPICDGNNGPYCTTEECAGNFGAYGWQLDGENKFPGFSFLACSGYNTTQLSQQVDSGAIPTDTDLLTVSIGGNDNNAFASVVKWCVYVDIGKCSGALANAQKSVQNIQPALTSLFKNIQSKISSKTTVVVTGYTRFWPDKMDKNLCQSHFLSNPKDEQRKTMNLLVDTMNAELKDVASQFKFGFLDPNGYFEGQRLCDVNSPSTFFQYEILGLVEASVYSHLTVADTHQQSDRPSFYDNPREYPPGADLDFYNRGVFHPNFFGNMAYFKGLAQLLGCTLV